MITPLSSVIEHFFSRKIPEKYLNMKDFPIISVLSRPTSRPTIPLLACVCLFLCGRVSFVVEGRRCVLFDAYATLSPWKDLDSVTLIDCCMSAVLEDCCLFVLAQSARELI